MKSLFGLLLILVSQSCEGKDAVPGIDKIKLDPPPGLDKIKFDPPPKVKEFEEVAKVFDNFFKEGKEKGDKAFNDWVQQSSKDLKKLGLKPITLPPLRLPGMTTEKPTEGGGGGKGLAGSLTGDIGGGEEGNIPVQGKVFAFYAKTYDCATSKVYEEFLKNYHGSTLPKTKRDNDDDSEKPSEKWLRKIAEKEFVQNTTDIKTTVAEAEEKIKSLEDDKMNTLRQGEAQMPTDARVFIEFIKSQGCQHSKLADYQKFNTALSQEIEKLPKEKKVPRTYYPAKAQTILVEQFS